MFVVLVIIAAFWHGLYIIDLVVLIVIVVDVVIVSTFSVDILVTVVVLDVNVRLGLIGLVASVAVFVVDMVPAEVVAIDDAVVISMMIAILY